MCSILYSLTIMGGGGGGKKSMFKLSGELAALVLGEPLCNRKAESLVVGGEWGGEGENTGDMGGGGGNIEGGAPSERVGVLGVVGVSGYEEWCVSPSFTSPSANCRKAEPIPLRDITNWACEAAKLWRDATVSFISFFLCLHLATPSSLSTLELEHPILKAPCESSDTEVGRSGSNYFKLHLENEIDLDHFKHVKSVPVDSAQAWKTPRLSLRS